MDQDRRLPPAHRAWLGSRPLSRPHPPPPSHVSLSPLGLQGHSEKAICKPGGEFSQGPKSNDTLILGFPASGGVRK